VFPGPKFCSLRRCPLPVTLCSGWRWELHMFSFSLGFFIFKSLLCDTLVWVSFGFGWEDYMFIYLGRWAS
jgi:hypothetical protein